ncbi:hypothetical protein [Corynebacterium sp. CCM 9203]|uniref:hypothetical protein n=1 Tax=Corynebacterium sp. CCM 9203 TaxID=3057615 RepID=UPI0035263FBC
MNIYELTSRQVDLRDIRATLTAAYPNEVTDEQVRALYETMCSACDQIREQREYEMKRAHLEATGRPVDSTETLRILHQAQAAAVEQVYAAYLAPLTEQIVEDQLHDEEDLDPPADKEEHLYQILSRTPCSWWAAEIPSQMTCWPRTADRLWDLWPSEMEDPFFKRAAIRMEALMEFKGESLTDLNDEELQMKAQLFREIAQKYRAQDQPAVDQ